jgi:hypothetical protein
MTFFSQQGIPEFLLGGYSSTEAEAEDDSDGEGEFEDDLDLLRSYSLVVTNANDDVFEMHRLVQVATRTWLRSFGGEDRWRRKFLITLSKAFAKGKLNNRSQGRLLLPHVEPLIGEEPTDAEEVILWAHILFNAASCTLAEGLYNQIIWRSLSGVLAVVSPIVGMISMFPLMVLADQGKYKKAGQFVPASDGRVGELGKEYWHTLTSAYCLAYLYHQCKRYDASSELYQRACDGFERTLGLNHATTVVCSDNFAKMRREMDDLKR